MKLLLSAACLAALSACAPEPSDIKVIVGGRLVDASGKVAFEHAVVVIDGPTVRAVGRQADIPIPAASSRVSGAGKTIAPQKGSDSIEPGKPANLVLISDGRVERAMQNGEWLDLK
jgi:hypothetical protein